MITSVNLLLTPVLRDHAYLQRGIQHEMVVSELILMYQGLVILEEKKIGIN